MPRKIRVSPIHMIDNGVSLVLRQVTSHYLHQCWLIVNWTPMINELRGNLNQIHLFSLKKCISKCGLKNGGHFVPASTCEICREGSVHTSTGNTTQKASLIARFMGPTWGPSGADRTQVGPMLAPWTLLSGLIFTTALYTELMSDWLTISQA